MAEKHTNLRFRPRALTIEALAHGGYAVKESIPEHRGFEHFHFAAFTRLADAVSWIEEQMRLPEPDLANITHAVIR
jgi:hypothetical protein